MRGAGAFDRLSPAGPGRRAPRLDRWLGLAATPTFAIAGLHAAFADRGAVDAICGAALPAAHSTGMVAMYVLMGVFHGTPWLRMALERPPSASAPVERTG